MKKVAIKNQGGFGLVEILIVLVIAGALIAAAVARSGKADNKRLANETAATISNVITTLRSVRAPSGTYNGLNAAEVNGMNVVGQPLNWNSGASTITDPWGNATTWTGNAATATPSFVVTIGGTVTPLDKEVCNILATTLVNMADVVNIGASTAITSTNGLVGGGQVYKSAGGTPNASNLSTGCSSTNPVIGLQFH